MFIRNPKSSPEDQSWSDGWQEGFSGKPGDPARMSDPYYASGWREGRSDIVWESKQRAA